MTLTSKVKPYKYRFGPFAPEVYHMPNANCYRCPFGKQYPGCGVACADYLEDFFVGHVAAEQTAALIAEPIQGEGGFITPPPEYFAKLQAICREARDRLHHRRDPERHGPHREDVRHRPLGHRAGHDPHRQEPGRRPAAQRGHRPGRDDGRVHAGGLGGTFAGNPIACAAALAVLEILEEEGLLKRAEALGAQRPGAPGGHAAAFELIGNVRGKGPMLALELVKDRETKAPAAEATKELVKLCYERGLMLLSCGQFGNVIRTLMPLVITDEQLDRGFDIMEESFQLLAAGTAAAR